MPPTPTNVTRRSRRSPAIPTTKALTGVSQPRYISYRSADQPNMPSPGGQISGMAGHQRGPRLGRVDRVWHPIDLPPGLPRGDPGAELPEVVAYRVEGCPRVAAWSDYARSTGCHTRPSVQDRDNAPPRRGAWPGKLLTKSQMFGRR
jgi:hypothetical protein